MGNDEYIKDYKWHYNKETKYLTLQLKDVRPNQLTGLKMNYNLMAGQGLTPKYTYKDNVFTMEIVYCPKHIAERLFKFVKMTEED